MITELVENLTGLLTEELGQLIKLAADRSTLIKIPDPAEVDLGLEEISSLVARSSNLFGELARLSGFAHAQAKIAKGRWDREFKKARGGAGLRNDKEREAFAADAASAYHEEMLAAEALASIAEALEIGARIASESTRKLLGSAENQALASIRSGKGSFAERDFSPY